MKQSVASAARKKGIDVRASVVLDAVHQGREKIQENLGLLKDAGVKIIVCVLLDRAEFPDMWSAIVSIAGGMDMMTDEYQWIILEPSSKVKSVFPPGALAMSSGTV